MSVKAAMQYNRPSVIACVPTYCETGKASNYLISCRHVKYRPFKLIIVNANPGDETSRLIDRERDQVDYEIIELAGRRDEFWSATVNRGLRKALEIADFNDWVLISNIDIEFSEDIVSLLIKKALEYRKCQIGALCVANNIVISSGTQVKSWITTSTYHPFSGCLQNEVSTELCVQVDQLATRFMLTPAQAIAESGLVSERLLPHYHADLEFSHRLHQSGYIPYIYTKARIEVDLNNTGESIYSQGIGFWTRIFRLMSIRNPSNPWYRMVFVVLVYPWYAWPTATLAYLSRTLIEVVLSKAQIQACFGIKGRGYAN